MTLQPLHRTELPVLVLDVRPGKCDVLRGHGKVGVAKHFLEREDTSPTPEEHHSEGVPEGIRGTTGCFYPRK